MSNTMDSKKLVLLALAILGPKVKAWTGYELTTDDVYTLIGAGVVIWHALEMWRAKRVAREVSNPSIADSAPPSKAP